MNRRAAAALLAVAGVLSGCWDQRELNELAFVQAAAIEEGEGGNIRLTAHVYHPGETSGSESGGGRNKEPINIATENATVFGASRDTSVELGRILQWSHMRVLLIGEGFARTHDIRNVLDFFSRDHEPRGTIAIMVTKGSAGDYLRLHPMIESSMGRELSKIENQTHRYAGKSTMVTLTGVEIAAREAVKTVALPYVVMRAEKPRSPQIGGLAVVDFGTGKLRQVIPPEHAPFVLMIKNRYAGGILNLPCGRNAGAGNDSFDVGKSRARVKPRFVRGGLKLDVRVDLEGSIGELVCSKVITVSQTDAFTRNVERKVETGIQDAFELLQRNRTDCLDIGNGLSRFHPGQWKKWRSDWPDRFARASVSVHVNVRLRNTGLTAGKKL
ncbi:Ger(x)C family spore germination protein [Cohnella caldifontis]|uniref:Ger(x)C family spore germination protein n=1 Tax=Cohnella caldifontis TaxID=3027471 RepID=UPI0023EB7647|nr:Ger(x)C family spore germination protein [Cohnella sp. YIM B05605]